MVSKQSQTVAQPQSITTQWPPAIIGHLPYYFLYKQSSQAIMHLLDLLYYLIISPRSSDHELSLEIDRVVPLIAVIKSYHCIFTMKFPL